MQGNREKGLATSIAQCSTHIHPEHRADISKSSGEEERVFDGATHQCVLKYCNVAQMVVPTLLSVSL